VSMNGTTRIKLYSLITNRDGEYCKGCGVFSYEKQLVLDHIDNNSKNNNQNNLQLLCRSCNYLKNQRPVDQCESECVNEGDATELETSRAKEPLFRKFIFHEINEYTESPERELLNSGSEDVGISPITAKRYLDKLCSSRGVCERVTRVKTVMIRYKSQL